MSKKYRLIKFESGTCAFCKAMDKSKVLEKFADEKGDVQVMKVSIADEKGVPYKDGEKWANAYGIAALPTLVIEDAGGRELARAEGALPLKAIRALYEQAQQRQNLGALPVPTAPAVGTPKGGKA
jgi:thioredoxin-related protein